MKKMVMLQVGLALIAFFLVGWVFFKERPQVVVNHELHQQLEQVKQQNTELVAHAAPVPHNTKQSRMYINQGRALFHEQDYEQALVMYDKALAVNPDDAYGWGLKGYTLFKAGHIQESIDANKRALDLDPGDPLDYINLAKSYCVAKQFDDALRVLREQPPSETAPEVSRYASIDGELRRVCKPILARLSNAKLSADSTKSNN
jgi:Flp pilus assembly protein TadD